MRHTRLALLGFDGFLAIIIIICSVGIVFLNGWMDWLRCYTCNVCNAMIVMLNASTQWFGNCCKKMENEKFEKQMRSIITRSLQSVQRVECLSRV